MATVAEVEMCPELRWDMKCKECERQLFVFGKYLLGKNAGGMINQLMQKLGLRSAWTALEMAASKQDPREYIGAAIKADEKPPITDEEFERLKAKYDAKVARS